METIIAETNDTNAGNWVYRISTGQWDDLPHCRYHVEMKRKEGTSWEHAMMGYFPLKSDLYRNFPHHYIRTWGRGEFKNLTVYDPKLKTEVDKALKIEQEREAEQERKQIADEKARIAEQKRLEKQHNNDKIIAERMKQAKAKRQKITLKLSENQTKTITAMVMGDYAYHDSTCITHVPSGLAVPTRLCAIFTQKKAREMTYRLSLMPEKWDGKGTPPPELTDAMDRVKEQLSRHEPF